MDKFCTKCNVFKILDDFSNDKASKDGKSQWCKSCKADSTKIWRIKNKDKEKKKKKEWKQNNKDMVNAANKRWRIKNKDKKKEADQKYQNNRRKIDVKYRIKVNLRSRLYMALKNNAKRTKTLDLLGCSIEDFKKHLELQFDDKMSWDNYGFGNDKWNIDHIVPCSYFDFSNQKDQELCFSYINMRPMWQIDNFKKASKINNDIISRFLIIKKEGFECEMCTLSYVSLIGE